MFDDLLDDFSHVTSHHYPSGTGDKLQARDPQHKFDQILDIIIPSLYSLGPSVKKAQRQVKLDENGKNDDTIGSNSSKLGEKHCNPNINSLQGDVMKC